MNIYFNGSMSENDTFKDDLYEVFKARETEQFLVYKIIAYIFGALIFLSNITVVISSGLILKKDNQRKSTYLLLGNVSLADMIIGVSIMFGVTIENPMSCNPLCIFQIGMIVCPAMVSIFTVGFIAVDRYIYILHGLYYQKWFTTTRVRISILCIWMIGITLSFIPASGWINTELRHSRCYYVTLFPGSLILLNSLLSIIPIVLVAVLYTIILIRALKNVREIKTTIKNVGVKSNNNELRIHIGGDRISGKYTQSVKYPTSNKSKIQRTSSFNENYNYNRPRSEIFKIDEKSKSTENLNAKNDFQTSVSSIDNQNNRNSCESDFSIYSISSRIPEPNIHVTTSEESRKQKTDAMKRKVQKVKEPNKWRAIIIVMLTSGSFIFTWMPFFITVIFFVFCEEKLTNPKCMHLRMMLSGPIATLAFLNSILNPMIYAWWHRGFQRYIKIHFRRYIWKFFQKSTMK